MIKTALSNALIIERYKIQLRDWEVAQLDAKIAHQTHKEIGSSGEVIDSLANRVIETEKAVRTLRQHIQELENPVVEDVNAKIT